MVKDPALSVLWLWSLLWHRFDPGPGAFQMLQGGPQKKKKKRLFGDERALLMLAKAVMVMDGIFRLLLCIHIILIMSL